jgi:hypothetical protein
MNQVPHRIVLKHDTEGVQLLELDSGGRPISYSLRAIQNIWTTGPDTFAMKVLHEKETKAFVCGPGCA